jgi:hypothetical protein
VKQPAWAPPAFGGAIVTGVAAALISGYEIADCLYYKTEQGQCNELIQRNTLPLVAGIAGIVGPLAGFMTLNPQLESPAAIRRRWDTEPELIPTPDPLPTPDPPDDIADPDDDTERIAAARTLRAQGLTQQAIADEIGVSRSTVQRWLKG